MNKNFAHFLQSLGYSPYEICLKDKKFVSVKDPDFISTYGPMCIEYFPKYLGPTFPISGVNRFNNFCYGLHEANHGPCLISPRPFVLWENDFRLELSKIYPDTIMDRLLEKYNCGEIYHAIIHNIVLVL